MPFLEINNELSDDKYKDGTKIKEIVALYDFDTCIRRSFFKYILLIETNIKNLIAYSFSQAHPQENYLVYTNFNRNLRDSNKLITNLISDIQRQISGRVSDPCIAHYLKQHGYIPLWVLNNILMYITSVRNFCAHNNRLYCYRTKRPLTNMPIHDKLGIPKNAANGEYSYGKRDLFAAVLGMKILLSDTNFKRFIKEINNAVDRFRPQMHVIKENELLSYMGFPENWVAEFRKAD